MRAHDLMGVHGPKGRHPWKGWPDQIGTSNSHKAFNPPGGVGIQRLSLITATATSTAKMTELSRMAAIMVPVSALFPIGSRAGVFVVEKNHAALQEVSIAARNGVSAWVKDGLRVGAQVIVYPDSKLKDGAKVTLR